MVRNSSDDQSSAPQDDLSRVGRQLAEKLNAQNRKIVRKNKDEDKQPLINKSSAKIPWLVQNYQDADIDLDEELTLRFPTMPLMSIIRTRDLGKKHPRAVATMTTQDGSASLLVEVDVVTNEIQLSFGLGSMLSLRFAPEGLSNKDRSEWLKHLKLEDKKPGFLWSQVRWETDYLVSIAHKYYTNIYAFSPLHVEAAVRLTPDVKQKLMKWLDDLWAVDKTMQSKPSTSW
jgi:hypothetical protein